MRTSTIGRRLVLGAAVLAGCTATPADPALGAAGIGAPIVATGGVAHVRGTSAVLNGTVDPHGAATTYYFQYGPTIAYGKQTTPACAKAWLLRLLQSPST